MSSKNRSHGIGVSGEAIFSPMDTSEQGINNYLNNFNGGNVTRYGWRNCVVGAVATLVFWLIWLGPRLL
jgi:hypothetical protein